MDRKLHDVLIAVSVLAGMAAEKMEQGQEEEALKVMDALFKAWDGTKG